jgi:peptidoglycan/LPS O-acetylase OafA/YrhL
MVRDGAGDPYDMEIVDGVGTTNGGAGFREDIEGLRAVAVLLVVLFHVEVAGFEAGFIGVDVFFVISGFLISKQLFGEASGSGRIGLIGFWGRRLRRLMPLLVVTVLATLVASLVVYSPLAWRNMASEAISASFYLSNVHFALDGVQYFSTAESPYLQTWSLGVEEQFYLGWPILFLLVALVAGRRRNGLRAPLVLGVASASVASFVAGALLTDRGTPWAFFGAPTRAWEFGAGALLFLVASRPFRPRRGVPELAGLAGAALLLVAMVRFDRLTPFPGTAAMVPVAGTVLLILSGTLSNNAVGRLLSIRPLRSLGRMSYGWYLLHWPAIVLVPIAVDRDDVATRLACALGALALAHGATRYVEQPLRDAPRLRTTGRVYLAAGAATAVLVVASVGVINWAERELEDPYLAMLADTRDSRALSGSGTCTVEEYDDGLSACVYGDPAGDLSIMLTGDSQAAQWAAAMETLAREGGHRLIVVTRGGCPAYDVQVQSRFGGSSSACDDLRASARRLLESWSPDVVVTSNADFSEFLLSPDGDLMNDTEAAEASQDAQRDFARAVSASDAGLAVIEPAPRQTADPVECLAKHRDPVRCSAETVDAAAFVTEVTEAEHAAFGDIGDFTSLSLLPTVCPGSHCLVQIDDTVVYSDVRHFARQFTEQQIDRLRELVDDADAQRV